MASLASPSRRSQWSVHNKTRMLLDPGSFHDLSKGNRITIYDILTEVLDAEDITNSGESLKALPLAYQAWHGFCSMVGQELALGRFISLAPLGTFFRNTFGHVIFRCADKLVMGKNLEIQGAGAGETATGPAARLRFERIAEATGWSRRKTEDVLKAILERAADRLGASGRGLSLEFPGLGTLSSSGRLVAFEAAPGTAGNLAGTVRRSTSSGGFGGPITASHAMFGVNSMARTGAKLLEPLPGQTLARQKELSFLMPQPHLEKQHTGDIPLSPTSPSLEYGSPDHKPPRSASAPMLPSPGPAVARTLNFKANKTRKPLAQLFQSAELSNPAGSLMRPAPVLDQVFPPLFDAASRTRAALLRGQAEAARPSDVIGCHWSPAAAALRVTASPKKAAKKDSGRPHEKAQDNRAIDWVSQWPAIPDGSPLLAEIEEAGLDCQSFCRALCRYEYYVQRGVPAEMQAPFKQAWLDKAVTLLDVENQQRWAGVAPEALRRVLHDLRQEILPDYERANTVAIVSYALLDGQCRERLDLPFVPSQPQGWGSGTFTVPEIGTPGGPPKEWKPGLAAAREGLVAAGQTKGFGIALRIQDFWIQECQDVKLLVCPERYAEALDVLAFSSAQAAQLYRATQQLGGKWSQVVKIVQEEAADAKSPDGQRDGPFLEAVGAQLSLLLRGVVERSLAEYGDLFERYAAELSDAEALAEPDVEDALVVNKLVINQDGQGGHELHFLHDLGKVATRLVQPYMDCARSLRGFERPSLRTPEEEGLRRAPMPVVNDEEAHVRDGCARIEGIVKRNLASAERVLELYGPFLFLLGEETKVEAFLQDKAKGQEDLAEYVGRLRDTVAKIGEQCPLRVHARLMRVETGDANQRLVQCAQDCISRLLQADAACNLDRCSHLTKRFEALNARVSRSPATEEQLVELEQSLVEARDMELPGLLQEFSDVKDWLAFAWRLGHNLQEEDYRAIFQVSAWKDFAGTLSAREAVVSEDRLRLEGKLSERGRQLLQDLTTVKARIEKFKDKANMRMLEDYLTQLVEIEERVDATAKAIEELQKREELLGWEPSGGPELEATQQALEPFKGLWTLVKEHQKALAKWTKTPLVGGQVWQQLAEIEAQAAASLERASQLQEHFEEVGCTRPGNVSRKVASELQLFQENFPLLRAVCNPALEERHWQDIHVAVGFVMERDSAFTLQRLLDMDIPTYLQEITEISEQATREREVEQGLDEQRKEWEAAELEFEDLAGTALVNQASFALAEALLQRHVPQTQELKKSPAASAFKARIDGWEGFLREAQNSLELWMPVQAAWLTFGKKGPQETDAKGKELIAEVDQLLHRCMDDCKRSPKFLEAFHAERFLLLNAANDAVVALKAHLGH